MGIIEDAAKEAKEAEPVPITVAEFLETVPPNTWKAITVLTGAHPNYLNHLALNFPEIFLFCANEACNGFRFFVTNRSPLMVEAGKGGYAYVTYVCRNCGAVNKTYALWFKIADDGESGKLFKFGEFPEFGPPTPSRVITLIGGERDLFLKGRRSENQGLGIGAFGYYRRVVENQKNRILDEVLKVSRKLGAEAALIAELEKAKEESQFSKAIETIKHGIPQALMIDGHNPLSLLHAALSVGLHNQSDEECLTLATSIRVVLTELADRMGQALKDEAELKGAVSKLLEVKSKKL
jgi:hypothetical protein